MNPAKEKEDLRNDRSLGFEMKFLEDAKNRHKDKEIWVIGAGPSLADFPSDFFDDKISIGCNAAWTAWNCAYIHFWHLFYMEMLMREDPSLLKECILCWRVERWKDEWYPKYLGWVTWMVWEGPVFSGEDRVRKNVRAIMEGHPEDCSYSTFSTVIHGAIQAAAVLGAKQITLCGCEHVYTKSLKASVSHAPQLAPYYRGHNDGGVHQDTVGSRPQDMRYGTKFFADEFRKYGVSILRYYYPDRYEDITDVGILPREKKE